MKRREFITLLGGAAVACPIAARAQRTEKLPIVGILGTSTPAAWSQWVAAFVQRMRELGWTEGRTIAFEYRWGEGSGERYFEIAAEFARLKVDVIVTTGNATAEAKQAAPSTPIVFAVANDPVGTGLVANLARPGGNHRSVESSGRSRQQATWVAAGAPADGSYGGYPRQCGLFSNPAGDRPPAQGRQ